MTTIAWSKGLLATDSRATNNGMIMPSQTPKIIVPPEDEYWEIMGTKVVVMACAGTTILSPWITDHLKAPGGITHRTILGIPNEHISGVVLIIDEIGLGWTIGVDGPTKQDPEVLILQPAIPPMALGSGKYFAATALALGRDAKKAIQIASKMDIFTGGLIQLFDIPDPVKVKSKRPESGSPNDLPVAPDPYGPVVPHPNAPGGEHIPDPIQEVLEVIPSV